MAIFILLAFVVLCVGIDALVQLSRRRSAKVPVSSVVNPRIFNEASVNVPKGIFFDRTHTWAFMEKNGLLKVGVDDFLLHITSPLNRVKMKNPGEKIRKGEALVSVIQNGKLLTLYAPVSGIIKSVNNELENDSSLINSSPYGDGWIYAIEPSNWLKEMQLLFMDDKYKDWLKAEFSRLKDFLAIEWKSDNAAFVPITLQDGGELKDHLLSDFGPEIWEEFQTKFIDTSR